jgi:hypothetical protein
MKLLWEHFYEMRNSVTWDFFTLILGGEIILFYFSDTKYLLLSNLTMETHNYAPHTTTSILFTTLLASLRQLWLMASTRISIICWCVVIRLSMVQSRSSPASFCGPQIQTSRPGQANSRPRPGPISDLDLGPVQVRTWTRVFFLLIFTNFY